MPTWYRMPIIGSFALDIDVEMPADLRTLERMVRAQVAERAADEQSRVRANYRSQLGIGHLQPVNGRRDGAALLAARTTHLAAVRDAVSADAEATGESWAYFTPRAIESRVRAAAEVATLRSACEVAEEHGVSELPRWRSVLMQDGHHAATARWRREVQDAWRRLKTGEIAQRDEQVDVGMLRRRLEDIAFRREEAVDA